MEIKEEIFEDGYKCEICGKCFSRKVQFNKHSLQHDSIVELDKCTNSEIKPQKRGPRRKKIAKFNDQPLLDSSRRNDCREKCNKRNNHSCKRRKLVKCRTCNEIFHGIFMLRRHKCPTNEQKPFSCSRCGEKFSWRDQLLYHSCDTNQSPVSESEHENQTVSDILSLAEDAEDSQCPVDKTPIEEPNKINFEENKPSDFNEHKELWSDRQPSLTCEVCIKVFPHKNAYYRHACTRIEETSYTCSKCKAQFLRQDELECHACNQNQTLVSGTEQNHPSLSSMNVDIFLASNNGLVVCSLCQRTFAQKGHLILHYRRHHKRELIAVEV